MSFFDFFSSIFAAVVGWFTPKILGGHYDLSPPTDVDKSAVAFELIRRIDGIDLPPVPYQVGTVPYVEAAYGAHVRIGWAASDASGNKRQPTHFLDFVAEDKIPTNVNGSPSVKGYREVLIQA